MRIICEYYKILIIGVIVGLLLPSFAFVQNQSTITVPETMEEARNVGIKALKIFPAVFKGLWQEALGVWQAMFRAIKSFWGKYIQPWFQSFWEKIKTSSFQVIEEEFKKEQKEMKEEAPRVGKSLWERFRELIK